MTSFLRDVAVCTKTTLTQEMSTPWSEEEVPGKARYPNNSHLGGQRVETGVGLVSRGWERFFSCLQSTTAHAQHRRPASGAIFGGTFNVVLLLQTMEFSVTL